MRKREVERLTDEELLMKAACRIVCPWCDAEKCVGRFECVSIKEYIDRKLEEDNGINLEVDYAKE